MLSQGVPLEEALDRCGGHSRFQMLSLAKLCLSVLHASVFTSIFNSSMDMPKLKCQTASDEFEACSEEVACGGKYLYENHDHFSIVAQWRLFCDKKYMAQVLYVTVVIGGFIGLLVIAWTGDRFGRLKTLRYLLILSVLAQFCILFAATPVYFAVVSFIVALCLAGSVLMPAVWLIEMTDNWLRGLYLTLGLLCWLIGSWLVPIFRLLVETWKQLIICDIAIVLVAMLLTFTLPESFRFYAGCKRRFVKARVILNKIASANGRSPFEEKLQGEERNEYNATGGLEESDSRDLSHSPESNEVSRNVVVAPPEEYMGYTRDVDEREKELAHLLSPKCIDMCLISSLRSNLLITLSISVSLGVLTGLKLVFSPNDFMISNFANLVGLVIACLIASYFGRKTTAIIGNLLSSGLGVLAAVIVEKFEQPEEAGWALLVSWNILVVHWLLMTNESSSTQLRCHVLSVNLTLVAVSSLAAYSVAIYAGPLIAVAPLLVTPLALFKMKKESDRPLLDSADDSKIMKSQQLEPVRRRPVNQSLEMQDKLNSI